LQRCIQSSTVVGFAVALTPTVQVGNKLMLALGYNEYGKEIPFFLKLYTDIEFL
jgi:hypothetical protein